MFSIGDKISHPMHGAGIITDIVKRSANNRHLSFYETKMICGAMVVLIPCDSCEDMGVRYVISSEEADELIKNISKINYEFNNNWTKRYRDNLDKIKSGDLYQVVEVVKSLVMRDREKNLSTGERKLLGMAKNIIVSELSLSTGRSITEIEKIITDRIIKE